MSAVVELKTKEEKDAELDKRIEALRKKNEALMKRHQEIEEDKKKAEQEGIAVMTSRKPRSHEPDLERRKTEKENLTVTVDLSKPTRESRVVNDRKSPSHPGPEEWDTSRPYGKSPPQRPGSGRLNRGGGISGRGGGHRAERRESHEGDRGEGPPRTDNSRGRRGGRGATQQGGTNSDRKSKEWEEKRRQNIEKMNEEMEKIAEYERGQRVDGEKNPTRNFLDDPRRSGPIPEMDRKEGSRRHVRNWGGLDFDNVKTGGDSEKEWTNRRPLGKSSVDMTMSMTGRERAEYLRWKKEREQIDEERLARHRSATGQWRREWDAQKTEKMFNEDPSMAGEGTPEQNSKRDRGRNARKQQRSGASEDSRRPPKAPTFADFLGQGKPREAGRGRGKVRGQGKSYSMHDNRWEAEKEEEKGIKEEQEKEKMKKEDKPSTPAEKQAIVAAEKPVHEGTAVEDDGDWEDVEECETEEEGSTSKDLKKSSSSPAPSTHKPKEKRTPRPKVQIPSAPQDSLTTPEGTKPLSPFTPLEGHHPVSDWGEEMEMLSPKSSLGESPLKFSSNESSPAQTKSREEECTDDATKPPELVDKQHATQPVPESTGPVIQEKSESSEPADSTSSSSQPTEEPSVQDSGLQNVPESTGPVIQEKSESSEPADSTSSSSSQPTEEPSVQDSGLQNVPESTGPVIQEKSESSEPADSTSSSSQPTEEPSVQDSGLQNVPESTGPVIQEKSESSEPADSTSSSSQPTEEPSVQDSGLQNVPESTGPVIQEKSESSEPADSTSSSSQPTEEPSVQDSGLENVPESTGPVIQEKSESSEPADSTSSSSQPTEEPSVQDSGLQNVPESTGPVIQEKSESSEPADSTSSSSQPSEEPSVQDSGMQNDESAASPLELEQNQGGIPTNSNDQPSSG